MKEHAYLPSENVPIETVGIIGLGHMGRSIAHLLLEHSLSVILWDNDAETLAASCWELELFADSLILESSQTLPEIDIASDLDDFGKAHLVFEAIPEKPRLKQKLFQTLEPHLPSQAIVASNTSSCSITELGRAFQRPERFCGFHFCHPVAERSLVELIAGNSTDESVLKVVKEFALRIGREPLRVKDSPGFLVNRLLQPLLIESLLMVEEGCPPLVIDSVADQFGLNPPPLAYLDEIGVDVILHAGHSIVKSLRKPIVQPNLLIELYSAGEFGLKTGRGIYQYSDKGKRTGVNPRLLHSASTASAQSLWNDREKIVSRMLLPVLVESMKCLQEKVGNSVGEIDRALVQGLGYPTVPGGIFSWAAQLGLDAIQDRLEELSELGSRFHIEASELRSLKAILTGLGSQVLNRAA